MVDVVPAAREAGPSEGAFVLAAWDFYQGGWVSVAVSEQRWKLEALAERLRRFLPIHARVFACSSVGDDDVVAALDRAPRGELVGSLVEFLGACSFAAGQAAVVEAAGRPVPRSGSADLVGFALPRGRRPLDGG